MDAPADSFAYRDNPGLRTRARERLYVVCQAGGWLVLLVLQLLFVRLLAPPSSHNGSLAASVQALTIGLLLTHYVRRWMTRWGWKELGWRPLVPRILAMAVALSAVWLTLTYGICYGLLRNPWPEKYSRLALIALGLTDGTMLMAGWLCLYFFYHLFDRYNRLRIEQLRLVAVVKEAELRALKSQINPHFIFNSLNSLRGLIDENPARARQAVTQLANLLRYSLQSGHLETVPFEDELNTVNDYLALEQVRHEARLRVRLDVAPEALHCLVPPMLLQTLVENAVKYGIAPRREGGEIVVRAWCARDDLRIEVTNPGALAANGGSTGVGLRNAGERLRLLFGGHAILRLREDPPGRVVAEVILPREHAVTERPAAAERAGLRSA